jgi:hypothetical protein
MASAWLAAASSVTLPRTIPSSAIAKLLVPVRVTSLCPRNCGGEERRRGTNSKVSIRARDRIAGFCSTTEGLVDQVLITEVIKTSVLSGACGVEVSGLALCIERMADNAEPSLAARREARRFGIASEAMMPMMATTISSSIKEKPF